MTRVFYLLFISLYTTNFVTESARILAVFPVPSISHQVVFRPVTQELAKRGHEVVIITPDPAFEKGKAPKNLTEIDVHDISYKSWREIFLKTSTGKQDDILQQLKIGLSLINSIFEIQIQTDLVQDVIKNGKFDLLLAEACVKQTLVFSYLLNIPVVQISSFGGVLGNFETMGGETHPLLYPPMTSQKMNNMSLWDKFWELYMYFNFKYLASELENAENEMLKRNFGPNTPTAQELLNRVEMMLLNLHPFWDSNRPVPPSVIYTGGLHVKPQKELPMDLKSYLDSSKHGVIYISFGTNVSPSLLPKDKIQKLVNVFSQLPYDVLWKWDKDDLPGRTSNIKISKWLPQTDLLRHPKIKLFITQGGLQSTDEAITAGVPLLGVPMLGDQWFNVEQYIRHKIGLRIDMESLTEDSFRNAINTIINDDSFRQNMLKLKSLTQDQPMKPLDRAIWWIEYVIRHKGAKHLRSPGANISWSEYLVLDVVIPVLVVFVLALIVVVAVLLKAYKIVSGRIQTSKKLKDS